jgi:[ribosomal protein S5]-alanine N-acetyltransferase
VTTPAPCHVVLEPRSLAHAEELYPLMADAEMVRFLDEDAPASVDALRAVLARSESRRSPDGSEHWLNWIVRDEHGVLVGSVQATIAADDDTNVAYAIGRDHWGRGFASSAVAEMIARVAADFGVTRFFIKAERANVRSVRLAERLGFTEVDETVRARKHATASEIVMQKVVAPPVDGPMRQPHADRRGAR